MVLPNAVDTNCSGHEEEEDQEEEAEEKRRKDKKRQKKKTRRKGDGFEFVNYERWVRRRG